jgi:hypothetical protein
MPDYRSFYDRNYIYAFDLLGRDICVTVSEVKAAKVKDTEGKEQKKPILFFEESKEGRGLVLCKTNGATIAALYGNNTENWIGKRITLFPTTTQAFGKTVECVRVRPSVPKQGTPKGKLAEAALFPTPESPEHAEVREPGQEG